MYVQYARELNPEDFDPPVAAKVHLILVHAGNISRSIHELIGVISDQTWIERLGVIPRASFERTALRTIAQLVAQFRAADNKLNSNIGEYLVSVSAAQGMEESFGHRFSRFLSCGRKKSVITTVSIFILRVILRLFRLGRRNIIQTPIRTMMQLIRC